MRGREVMEQKHSTGMNGAQSKLRIHTQLVGKRRKSCKTPYETPPTMIAEKDSLPALAQLKHCLNYM